MMRTFSFKEIENKIIEENMEVEAFLSAPKISDLKNKIY